MPVPDFTSDQVRAIEAIRAWLGTSEKTLKLGGLAGTGKSFVVGQLVKMIVPRIAVVCAYTGKAAFELRRKGVENACTMHRVLYGLQLFCQSCEHVFSTGEPEDKCPKCDSNRDVVTKWKRHPIITADLVIVDEASMLAREHVEDLEAAAKKVLYVGDHGQLEPIGDDPGIMADPDIRLEQIHRQAAGSPIIQFAHRVRMRSHPATFTERGDVTVRFGFRTSDLMNYDAIICGYNRTRVDLNRKVRKIRGFEGPPKIGERLICLQNDSEIGVFNGMLVFVRRVRDTNEHIIELDLENEIGERFFRVPALLSQFDRESKPKERVARGLGLFDFGYAMTCHKAQGSQWPKVAVLEQIGRSWTASRWRYTAATRASQKLDYFLSEGTHR